MKSFFKDKLEYNFTSNKSVLQILEEQPETYTKRVQKLLSHTLNAHAIWNQRILQKEDQIGIWATYQISELQHANNENQTISLAIVSEIDLAKEISYTNSQNKKYTNRVADILYHIINHSTYHRGQLVTELKNLGAPPITTDFIFFKR